MRRKARMMGDRRRTKIVEGIRADMAKVGKTTVIAVIATTTTVTARVDTKMTTAMIKSREGAVITGIGEAVGAEAGLLGLRVGIGVDIMTKTVIGQGAHRHEKGIETSLVDIIHVKSVITTTNTALALDLIETVDSGQDGAATTPFEQLSTYFTRYKTILAK